MGHWTQNQDPATAISAPWSKHHRKWEGWTEEEKEPAFEGSEKFCKCNRMTSQTEREYKLQFYRLRIMAGK